MKSANRWTRAGLGARTSLLDGGMGAWVKQGGAVTRDVPAAKPGTLATLKTQPLIVEADYVRRHLDAPGIAVVDGRAAATSGTCTMSGFRAGRPLASKIRRTAASFSASPPRP